MQYNESQLIKYVLEHPGKLADNIRLRGTIHITMYIAIDSIL